MPRCDVAPTGSRLYRRMPSGGRNSLPSALKSTINYHLIAYAAACCHPPKNHAKTPIFQVEPTATKPVALRKIKVG